MHGYCEYTVIKKDGQRKKRLQKKKSEELRRQIKAKAHRKHKYMWREKGNRRTIPTTTCKEKTKAEHANERTRAKLREGIS